MSTRLLLSIVILICLTLAVYSNPNAANPRVKTIAGKLKGYYKTSQNGRQYEAYEGIPYAYPPIGKLRFQPPRALPKWTGELLATSLGPECLQFLPIFAKSSIGSEDCLYLNIYIPMRNKTASRTLLPVLFGIHGGAFQLGSSNDLGPEYLMDYDVIFVTFNYRLGPMGFLSTEDEVVPGNMGLKDQSMALHWVSDNIEWFGGDSQKITLIGVSAGAASVHYHYLSPMSAGLFQGGISISGTALNCWAQTENSLDKAKQLSNIIGCPTISSKDMINCLRYRPAHEIVKIMNQFMPLDNNPYVPFGPVQEKAGDIRFIDRTPIEIIYSGDIQDVPWITSVVSEEGLFPVSTFMNNPDYMKNLNDNWNNVCPILLDFNFTIPEEMHAEISGLIWEHYIGMETINKANIKSLVKLITDRFFVYDSEKAAIIQAEVNQKPVWYYYYSYRGAHSVTEVLSGSNENYGVSHGDDALSILKNPIMDPTTTADDRNMQKHLIDMWLSFAINGIPSVAGVEWLKVDPKKEFQYLHLTHPTKIHMDTVNIGNKEFWDKINFDENKFQYKNHKHTTTKLKVEL